MPISITLHPVDKTPETSQSNILGLDSLPSLPIIKSAMPLHIASEPRAFPRSITTSSVRSLKATPLISLALNICSFICTMRLYPFNNPFGLYKIIYIDRI